MGLLDRMIHGGPEYQKRKAEEKAMKAEAHVAEMKAMRKGMVAGSTKKGYTKGFAKGSGQGGLSGAMGSLAAGAKAFDKAGTAILGNDFDFGAMGQSSGGISVFGMGETTPRRHRAKPRTHHKTRRRK
jgi:hypothetical protein